MIPLFKVFMSPHAGKLVNTVLQSGYIGEGPQVKEFEKAISERIGTRNVVAINSCTSALQLALRLSNVSGKKVISTPMTCLATNMAIRAENADIVWADVERDTGNISTESVERILHDNSSDIAAVMCVHWAGYPCDIKGLQSIAHAYGIPVIEDAAHAFLSTYHGYSVGYYSDFCCFSFQAIKHLTTGDGGMLVVRDDKLFNQAKLLKWFCLDREISHDMRCNQDPHTFGYKYHMNDISASIGLANLKYIEGLIDKCRENALRMRIAIKDMNHDKVQLLDYDESRLSSYWLFSILVDDIDSFISHMNSNNIACSKVHERNDTKKCFKKYKSQLHGLDYFASKQVCIPCGWWVRINELNHIIETIRSY